MKRFAFAIALTWATSASALQHYAQTVLPFGFFGSDRNSAGTIVGSFTDSSGGSMAAAFAGGSVTLLPGADFARGINDLGTMIAVTINSRDHGFIRAAGDSGWTELQYPGFPDLQVFDINNAGVVGGAARNPPVVTLSRGVGFYYQNGVFTPLPGLPGGGVFSLNDLGDATGRFLLGSAYWMYVNGVYTAFNGSNFQGFEPGQINNNQQIAGYYRNAAGQTVAAVLENGVLRDVNQRPSSAFALNDNGQVIGYDGFGLFLYDPYAGRSFTLNSWIDGAPINGVSGIYNDGTILGWRYASVPGGVESVLLTPYGRDFAPVPEPGTWAMMIAGFGVIGTVMRRRAKPGAATAGATA